METLVTILAAAAPLLGQLMALVNLFVEAKAKPLTAAEVEAEIARILQRSENTDAIEDRAAGIK